MKRTGLSLTLVASLVAGSAFADQATEGAIKARQSLMQLYAFNLGALGAMAKGAVPYDAEAASSSAANLLALSSMSQAGMWPQGSDNGSYPDSKALPEIWTKYPDVVEKGKALGVATAAMDTAAGTDLAALQGAMKALGGACGACHKAYRQEE
ncbi:MAG: cytochrome c [Rhodobacteraceae bacterium]|nr:cytochrome c [Paracoccaceae bacterium]